MVLLSSIEFIEELGGKAYIVVYTCGGGGGIVSGCGGLVGWVGVLQHPLSMVDTKRVLAKGSIGVFVFKGLSLLLALLVLFL